MTPKTPRPVAPRIWNALTIASAAVALTAGGPALAEQAGSHDHDALIWLAQAEGGEGGEGGESGAVAETGEDAASQFLTELALIEGHLRAGFALFAADRADLAITHMKHPKDEIYSSLEPQLARYNAVGFADELTSLALSVETQKPLAEVQAAYDAVLARIGAARTAQDMSARDTFDAILAVTRVAAEEYAIGVVDGKIANLHEYQDAWGFIETAKSMADGLIADADPTVSAAATDVRTALEDTAAAFDGLIPEAITGKGNEIIAAAGEIELAAYGIK